MIQTTLEKTLDKLIERFGTRLKCVLLYGSWAAGTAREDSDIDLLAVLNEKDPAAGKSIAEYETMAASTIEECDRLLDMINTMLMISKPNRE
jgi:predicted nucleotidyltransferase